MKVCLHCGAMISPHPMHREVPGICADCHNETLDMVTSAMGMKTTPEHLKAVDEIDTNRPKLRGKHMMIQKTPAEIAIEKRRNERQHIARY
jgi:hypothetical protein